MVISRDVEFNKKKAWDKKIDDDECCYPIFDSLFFKFSKKSISKIDFLFKDEIERIESLLVD